VAPKAIISRVKFLPIAWAGMPKTIYRKNSDSLYSQKKFNQALVEDCWQEFCGYKLQLQLQSYDPEKGSIDYWLGQALRAYAHNFYKKALRSFEQCASYSVDSIDEAFTDTDEQDGSKNAIRNKIEEKTQTASITDNLEIEELKEANKKINQDLSSNDQMIIDAYLDLKSETTNKLQMGSRDKSEQVAALMNEKGLLNPRSDPYTAMNVRKIYNRFLDDVERYFKDNGLSPKNWSRPRNKR
jgi:hypothetical protein